MRRAFLQRAVARGATVSHSVAPNSAHAKARIAAFEQTSKSLVAFFGGVHNAADAVPCLMRDFAVAGRLDGARRLLLSVTRDFPLHFLSAAPFDTLLQLLVQQESLSITEVHYVIRMMQAHGLEPTSSTFQSLLEAHLRMHKDCTPLWSELRRSRLKPSSNILRLLIRGAVPASNDVGFIVDVAREYVAGCEAPDKDVLCSLYKQVVAHTEAAPEHALWLLFEIEQRCVVDTISLKQVVERSSLVQLLLKSARCGDCVSAERLVACMERHMMPRTADILSLTLWSYVSAQEIELALDTLEEMSRKGFMETTDINKKWILEELNMPMEKHWLNHLGESMDSTEMVDRAYLHLEQRHRQGRSVSIDSLDAIVMACGRLGDEDRAVETMESYTALGVHPRTKSYNALLLSCAGRNKARQHKTVFEAMLRNGVTPNYHTFRLLIRQAVLCDNVEEALEFVDKAPNYKGVHVDVEMLLPILERAAFVGDEATVLRMMKKAIQCDIGFSSTILRSVVQRLKNHGVDTGPVEELVPVHERMKTKTGLGRRRPR